MRENTQIYLAHILNEHHGQQWPNHILQMPVKTLLDTIKQYDDVPTNKRLYNDLERFIQEHIIT